MVCARSVLAFGERRRSVAEVAFIVIALATLAGRALEISASPIAFVRIVISALVVGLIIFAPLRTLARRTVVLIALEVVYGTAAFAFVDAPLVVEHRGQIGSIAIAIAERVDRFERAGIAPDRRLGEPSRFR